MSQLASLADLSLSLQLGGTGTAIPPWSTEIGGELKQHICLSEFLVATLPLVYVAARE